MNVSATSKRSAPLLQVGPNEFIGGFTLGESILLGALVVVELIHPNGALAGHICSSLADAQSISPANVIDLAL